MDIQIIITIILAIILVVFGLGLAYMVFIKDDNSKEPKTKEELSKEQKLKKIGAKMLLARENLEKNDFKIDTELISPIEEIKGNIYIKLVHFDLDNKKMAVTSISQAAKHYIQNVYDLKHAIDCKIFLNDNENIEEARENPEFKSLQIEIQSLDTYNPKVNIGILPKLASNPEVSFKKEYIDFGMEIYRIIKEIIRLNRG